MKLESDDTVVLELDIRVLRPKMCFHDALSLFGFLFPLFCWIGFVLWGTVLQ